MRSIARAIALSVPVLLLAALAMRVPASAGGSARPDSQAGSFATPTPGPDGKIVYIIQEGDTLWVIAARAGLSVEQLRALNGLAINDFIVPGKPLLLGFAGPAQPTAAAGEAPTPTTPPPTPTPVFGTATICALLFVDQNGNARLDAGEPPLGGGQVSIADVSGRLAEEFSTQVEYTEDNLPLSHCIADLQTGDYNVSAAVPPDYNPTTVMSIPVRLDPGDTRYVEFAAQPSAALVNSGDGGGTRSTALGLLGLLLLAAAAGLAVYAARLGRKSPRWPRK
ncbi:MAG: LysM peptidoglycan-binding domain-containing protein [Anaerolineales bacterium]|nr:LysM peptidoglycan-binding domain-containing protein [Anaerolineales bacterium]